MRVGPVAAGSGGRLAGATPRRRTLLVLAIATPQAILRGSTTTPFAWAGPTSCWWGCCSFLREPPSPPARNRTWLAHAAARVPADHGRRNAGTRLGGAFTPDYPHFLTPHPINLAFALASNLTLVLGIVALLVAWRDEAGRAVALAGQTDRSPACPTGAALRNAPQPCWRWHNARAC